MICSACGASNKIKPLARVESYRPHSRWGQCDQCKAYVLITENDRPAEQTHEVEVEYFYTRPWGDPGRAERLNRFKKRLYSAILELAESINPPPASLLDVGCSYGGLVQLAKSRGYEVCGYDLLPAAVQQVQESGIECHVASSSMEFSTIVQRQWNIITCVDVHYYWHDQRKELETLLSMLAPGGIIILRARTMNWLVSFGRMLLPIAPRLGRWCCRKALRDYQFSMSANQLVRLIDSCGGEVIYASPARALPSGDSSLPVRLQFAMAAWIWTHFKLDISLGFLVIFKRKGD